MCSKSCAFLKLVAGSLKWMLRKWVYLEANYNRLFSFVFIPFILYVKEIICCQHMCKYDHHFGKEHVGCKVGLAFYFH